MRITQLTKFCSWRNSPKKINKIEKMAVKRNAQSMKLIIITTIIIITIAEHVPEIANNDGCTWVNTRIRCRIRQCATLAKFTKPKSRWDLWPVGVDNGEGGSARQDWCENRREASLGQGVGPTDIQTYRETGEQQINQAKYSHPMTGILIFANTLTKFERSCKMYEQFDITDEQWMMCE